jgi:hypothetical protein
MRFAQESVKLQFDNIKYLRFRIPRAGPVITQPQTEKHREPHYIRARMRRFKEPPVAAWCLKSDIRLSRDGTRPIPDPKGIVETHDSSVILVQNRLCSTAAVGARKASHSLRRAD